MPAVVHGIDVSSHQPRDLSTIIATHRPQHIVVKLYLPIENISQDHSRAQIASARATGCTVGGYVWCYRTVDPQQTVRDAVTLARSCSVTLPILWLDSETYTENGVVSDPGPNGAWLRAAMAEAATLGVRVGIYTGGWWWREYMDNTSEFAELPLWLAEYDGNTNIDAVNLFGGWTHASGKQWAVKLPDGGDLDRDVFLEECTGAGRRVPTLAELEINRPNLAEQVLTWQRARYGNGQDANDYEACRTHLTAIGVRDPGPVAFVGFRRPTIEELEAGAPQIRQNLRAWQSARRQVRQDPNDYAAGRRHLVAIHVPDPGPMEFLGFAE